MVWGNADKRSWNETLNLKIIQIIARAHRISGAFRGQPLNGDLGERHDLATGLKSGPTMAQETTVSRADLQATEPDDQE